MNNQSKAVSLLIRILLYSITIFVSLNFANSINLQKVSSWPEMADMKEVVKDISEMPEKNQEIGVEWYFERSISYYKVKNKLDFKIVRLKNNNDLKHPKQNIIYINQNNLHKINETSQEFRIIKKYPVSNTVLIKLAPK